MKEAFGMEQKKRDDKERMKGRMSNRGGRFRGDTERTLISYYFHTTANVTILSEQQNKERI